MKISITLILSLVLCMCSCVRKEKSLKSNQLIFKVGQSEYYGYNFKKDFNEFKKNYVARYDTFPPADSIINFFKKIEDQMYVMADAFSYKIDTLPEVKKLLAGMLKYKMTTDHGFLWQAMVKPKITPSQQELKDTYKVMKKIYHVTSVIFKDSINAQTFREQFKSYSKNDFTRYASQNNKVQQVEDLILQWPFNNFPGQTSYLENLQRNAISKPLLTKTGWAILHVDNIEISKLQTFEKLKPIIRRTLENLKASKVAADIQNKILTKSRYNINDPVFHKILPLLIHDRMLLQESDIQVHFRDIADEILFTYQDFNDISKEISVREFNDYYYYQPIRDKILNGTMLKTSINNYIIDDYFWKEGKKLGLLNQDDAIYGYKWFKNKELYFFMCKPS